MNKFEKLYLVDLRIVNRRFQEPLGSIFIARFTINDFELKKLKDSRALTLLSHI